MFLEWIALPGVALRRHQIAAAEDIIAEHVSDFYRRFERRDDDSAATVRRRLEIYERITAPVLDHYKSGLFFDFNGDQPPSQLFGEMQLALGFRPAHAVGL